LKSNSSSGGGGGGGGGSGGGSGQILDRRRRKIMDLWQQEVNIRPTVCAVSQKHVENKCTPNWSIHFCPCFNISFLSNLLNTRKRSNLLGLCHL
jgi:hypothetical protein